MEDFDDDLCLYRADIDEVLVLNSTAADVWRCVDGSHDVDHIVTILAEAYSVNESVLRSDVEATLADFVARGYLRFTDPDVPTAPQA